MTPALELLGIHRRFGSVHALRGADFTLLPGELHALLGENGAGKTTLMQVAAGLVRPDAGEILVGGISRGPLSPRSARQLGVGMVHQHFTSIPAFTVAENVALAAGWPVSPRALRHRVLDLCERVGLPLDPDARVEGLSVGVRQRLEIVKALAGNPKILLLDEPTAVLAPGEVGELLRVIRRFTSAGGAAVLITHKLDEALTAADRVTVLHRGAVVLTGPVAEHTASSLAIAMIGEGEPERRAEPLSEVGTPADAPLLIRIEALDVARDDGLGIALRDATLSVRGGEIIGIAAVEGNGQRELLRMVAGRVPPLRGRREVAEPIAFIPEDRTTEGLIPEMTLTENLVLGASGSEPWARDGRIDWDAAADTMAALIREYAVSAPGPDVPAGALSGGNQQRIVIARELARRPRVVVAENPTRGLDIRAAEAIRARLRRAAADGAAILVYSSDLDEVLHLATRVMVASRGSLLEPPAGAAREVVGELMLAGA